MPAEDRAQTAMDFAVGIGIFFVAMGFVLAFVPSMFAPFFGMGVGDALVADRSAAHLAEQRLVEDSGTPGALDGDAVDDFFEDCDAETLSEELRTGTERINVSIGGDTCGKAPESAETVSIRIVTVDGIQERLQVVVW